MASTLLRWQIADYHRMIETGLLRDRAEFIRRAIPQNSEFLFRFDQSVKP